MTTRTIKFRGKRLDNGEWLYGSLMSHTKPTTTCYIHADNDTADFFSVDPETVGQFTGRTDRNGKEIYEGDIISRIKYSSNYKLEWRELDAKFILKRIGDDYPLDFFELRAFNEQIEVIGNIYEVSNSPDESATSTSDKQAKSVRTADHLK